MRTLVLLAAFLLAFGGLAGCFTGDDGDGEVTPNSDDGTTGTDGQTGTDGGKVTVLAPLKGTVMAEADAWLAPGSSFPVSIEAPKNARGNVTYTWAIGPAVGTVDGPAAALDTKNIDPGASKTLKFDAPGVYTIHCHPHPYMLSNVTVVEGYSGPSKVVVSIVDGANPSQYRFVPENIVVAPGTTVEYKNVGQQVHTATLSSTEPALKALPLKTASGDVALEGDGWQRVVVIMQDEEGRVGVASHNVYVKDIPANFADSATGTIEIGTGSAPVAPPAELPVGTPQQKNMAFEHGGRAFINVTVDDPTGEVNTVSVHLRKQGETQDTMTLNAGTLAADGVVNAGQYVLEVVGEQGANIEYTVTVDVVYDLVPPAIVKAEAPAGDAHGGHAH